MGKEQLNTGHKSGSRTVANSHTSPKSIRLAQKRSAALDYRLQGHPYWKIGKALGCHPSTAQSYVVRAMKDMLPVEKRQEILAMEMQRLDMMQAAVYRNAEDGDIPSQEAVLKIMHARARYLGLYPDQKGGGQQVHLNINGPAPAETEEGIVVTFVHASKWGDPDVERLNGKPVGPVLDLPVVNGGNGGSK
jgi:hypothetical protein